MNEKEKENKSRISLAIRTKKEHYDDLAYGRPVIFTTASTAL